MPPQPSTPAPTAAYPSCVPVLSDGVVTLRAHQAQDADAIVEQGSDPESARWTMVPRPYARSDAEGFLEHIAASWLEPAGPRIWAIEWIDDEGARRFGGSVDLRPRSGRLASIGYGLHPAARGRGVMARAVRLACSYGFDVGFGDGPLVRVHWSALVGNFESWRVAWATGFTHHATIPGLEGQPDQDGTIVARDCWVSSLAAGEPMTPHTPWADPPVLTGDGIRLRPYRDDDGAAIEDLSADPAHHVPPRSMPTVAEWPAWLLERRARMARGSALIWCIADATTDRALGNVVCFVHNGILEPPVAEVGYLVFPSARGRGIATQAARLVVAHALAPIDDGGLGMHRLLAITAADNEASNRVLESVGFTRWGTEHETDELPDGTWQDAHYWELIPTRS